MLEGVRLVERKLKEAPVAIETCAVVIAPALFAVSTLRQLQSVLSNPKKWVGWSVTELIDRLVVLPAETGLLNSI